MAPPVRRAKSVVKSLKAVLHEVSLKAPSSIATHPSFLLWMEELQSYWESYGPLHLGITPFHFWLESIAWPEETDDTETSFSCSLYRAGLRGLSFSPHFSKSQALWFVVLLGQWARDRKRLDLVSLLWTRSFEGFSYEEYNPVDESVVWDGWELEEVVRGLYELQKYDPLQYWNFAVGEEAKEEASYSSRDSLQGIFGEVFSSEEKEIVHELLFEEDEQIPLRASDLFLLVLMHCESPEDIKPLQSWLAPIATSLVNHQMWHALTFLVEDLQRMETQLPETIQMYAKEMVEQLLVILSLPNNLTPVTKHLMEWSRLTLDEQVGLRMYLKLLASHTSAILDDMVSMEGERARQQIRALMIDEEWETVSASQSGSLP